MKKPVTLPKLSSDPTPPPLEIYGERGKHSNHYCHGCDQLLPPNEFGLCAECRQQRVPLRVKESLKGELRALELRARLIDTAIKQTRRKIHRWERLARLSRTPQTSETKS